MARKLVIDNYSDLCSLNNGYYNIEYFPETENLWILDNLDFSVMAEINCMDKDIAEISQELEMYNFDAIEFNEQDNYDVGKMVQKISDYIQDQRGTIDSLQHEINQLETELGFDSCKLYNSWGDVVHV